MAFTLEQEHRNQAKRAKSRLKAEARRKRRALANTRRKYASAVREKFGDLGSKGTRDKVNELIDEKVLLSAIQTRTQRYKPFVPRLKPGEAESGSDRRNRRTLKRMAAESAE